MATNEETFHAIIEVINRATAPLRTIEADIYGLMAPITAVNVGIAHLAEETGFVALGEHAAVAMEKVSDLGREIGALLGPVALIGGALSAEGLLEFSKKASEYGEALGHSSEKTGIDIPIIARLHYVAQLEDVDEGAFDKAVGHLNGELFKAMQGKNKDLDAMLTAAEGPMWKKRVKSAEDGLGLIADAYQKARGPLVKARVLAEAFGDRMGQNMVPILLKSRQELKEMGDEFERLYGKWTPERVAQAKEAADNWKKLTAAGEGLALFIGSAITPAIQDLIVPLREWIVTNRSLISQHVDEAVRSIGETLRNVDWHGIGSAIGTVGSALKAVGDVLGAQGVVFAGAALIFGPIITSAVETAVALGKLGIATLGVAARLGILAATQVYAVFADLVTGIKLAIPVIDALDLALDANPIGAAILAATALAGVGYVIYEYWKPISGFFSGLWDGIADAATAVAQVVGNVWDGVAGVVGDTWQAIKAAAAPVVEWLGDVWTGATISIREAWRGIGDMLSGVWDGIKSVTAPVAAWLGGVWKDIATAVGGAMRQIGQWLQPLGQMFKTVWDGIGAVVQSVWKTIGPIFDRIGKFLALVGKLAGSAIGTIVTSIPGVSVVVHDIQQLHDIGKADREWGDDLESHFAVPTVPAVSMPTFNISGAQATRAPADPDRNGARDARPLVDLARRGAAALAAAMPNGQVDVNVRFDNVPRGTKTEAKTRGNGLKLNTGKSFQQ